jgi:opacity protein-like surface antigen
MKSRSILIAAAVLLALSAPSAAAKDARWVLDFENGAAFSGYNNIAVPGDTGTRFSLSKDFKTDAAYFYRLRLTWRISPRHSLSVLYAPLKFSASGVSPFPIYFYGTDFPEGAPVKGSYKFNSYRLTYRYELVRGGKWKVGVGFTAKIRDAAIGLESGALSATRKNVGPVPLLNVHIERWLSPKAGLLLDADALAAPQGRAEDVLLAIMVRISPSMTLRAGYRFVEGGADNDKVYTFALIHYASVGISIDL